MIASRIRAIAYNRAGYMAAECASQLRTRVGCESNTVFLQRRIAPWREEVSGSVKQLVGDADDPRRVTMLD